MLTSGFNLRVILITITAMLMFAGEQHPGGDQGDAVEADGDDPGVAGDGSSSGAHRDAAPQSDGQQGSSRPAGRPQPR